MVTGKVIWFNVSKGFGFIKVDSNEENETQRDVYFNIKSLVDPRFPPLMGDHVSFGTIKQKDNRLAAINVKIIL